EGAHCRDLSTTSRPSTRRAATTDDKWPRSQRTASINAPRWAAHHSDKPSGCFTVAILVAGKRGGRMDRVVISADSHVMEPADLWTSRVDADLRDIAPQVVRNADGPGYVFRAPGLPPSTVAGSWGAG